MCPNTEKIIGKSSFGTWSLEQHDSNIYDVSFLRNLPRRWRTTVLLAISSPSCMGIQIHCFSFECFSRESWRGGRIVLCPSLRGVDPDTRKAEACAEVERLQKALDALGTLGGPEVEAIKKSLKKAQEAGDSPSSGEPARVWRGWSHSKQQHQPPRATRHAGHKW